jgi:hypothetical protein
MDCEIRFLNAQGKLSCSLWAGFTSERAAVRYAQAVMTVGACKRYASAEICKGGQQYPFLVLRQDQSAGQRWRDAVQPGADGGSLHI